MSEDHRDDQKVKIILNGRVVEAPREMSFQQITELAFPSIGPNNPNIDWMVDFRGPNERPGDDKLLKPGGRLSLERGMVIDVSYTDKS